MKALVSLGLLGLLAAPAAAQDGPIARSVRYGQAPPVTTTYSTAMRSPGMFWSGVTLVATGVIVTVAGVTWAQESDLSSENANTRLGRDLAPCGTDPTRAVIPVADCKANTGLVLLGSGMEVAGGLLMVIGGQTVQITQIGPRTSVLARLRF